MSEIALTATGQLYAWGSNAAGQAGDGTNTNRPLPAAVLLTGALAGKTPVAIAAGRDHCVALTSEGKVYGWGDNTYGETGDQTMVNRNAPVAVLPSGWPAGRVVRAIDAGTGGTVALTEVTALEGWRRDQFGTIAAAGMAGDNADPDKDGLENLAEYGFGLNPNIPDAEELPQWVRDDDTWVLSFLRPGNVAGVTYVAEYSNTLAPGSWTAAANAGTGPDYLFYANGSGPRLYLRVRVTAP